MEPAFTTETLQDSAILAQVAKSYFEKYALCNLFFEQKLEVENPCYKRYFGGDVHILRVERAFPQVIDLLHSICKQLDHELYQYFGTIADDAVRRAPEAYDHLYMNPKTYMDSILKSFRQPFAEPQLVNWVDRTLGFGGNATYSINVETKVRPPTLEQTHYEITFHFKLEFEAKDNFHVGFVDSF